jgi:PAS domain S-box-containing protein
MEDRHSRDPLFAYDATMRILLWNGEAERLTGILADEAAGRWCWDVLRAVDDRGPIAQRSEDRATQPARAGRPVTANRLVIQTETGRKLVTVSALAADGAAEEPIVLELLRNGDLVSRNGKTTFVPLTPRQCEVLQLLAHGLPTKLIATRLSIAEATVGNDIEAILGELRR